VSYDKKKYKEMFNAALAEREAGGHRLGVRERVALSLEIQKALQSPKSETRFDCRSCGKQWFLDNVEQIERANKAAKISNLGRSMTPVMWLSKKKQIVDLNHCPDCGSNNITRTNIVEGIPTPTPMEPESTSPASTATAAQTYISDELLKLATLRDQGILTEQEFQMQKAKLLGSHTANQIQQRRFDPQTGQRL
jgi:predicted RNA-binding Zn-ribbon protein involved in translation (DUF1610 family)